MTDWRIALADLDLGTAEVAAVTEVLRSRWLTMGPKTEEFEVAFARHHGAPHAIAVANGTAALHLAYAGLGLSAGDEIILPSLTFVATANAAVLCGARPVFADIIGEEEPTLDPEHVASLVTPRTRVIVPVHYGGYGCRMERLLAVADKHGLSVVEDCAHAPGVREGERYLGTWGTAGCFSFFSNKNMTTGEGGMLLVRDAALAARIRLLRSHGMTSGTWKRHLERPQDYDVLEPGWNYRIDELRSALGLVQLSKLEVANARRAALTRRYRQALERTPAVRVAFRGHAGSTACHLLALVAEDRDRRREIVASLTAAGVQTSHHYPPIHLFKAYREKFGYAPGMLPRTESFASRQVTLPLHPGMSEPDVDFIAGIIRDALSGTASRRGGVGRAS